VHLENRSMGESQVTLTCPECKTLHAEVMPTDRCIYFYECRGCRTLLRPRPGGCCVFCSYGDRQCPPRVQGSCSIERS
jgi:hypothetical protein